MIFTTICDTSLKESTNGESPLKLWTSHYEKNLKSMTNSSKPEIRQRFIDAWNILTGRRIYASDDYSSSSDQGIINNCPTCAVHEEYETYLKAHIKTLDEANRVLVAKLTDNPVESGPSTEVMQPITARRNFKDIRRELELKHKVQAKEAVNG